MHRELGWEALRANYSLAFALGKRMSYIDHVSAKPMSFLYCTLNVSITLSQVDVLSSLFNKENHLPLPINKMMVSHYVFLSTLSAV